MVRHLVTKLVLVLLVATAACALTAFGSLIVGTILIPVEREEAAKTRDDLEKEFTEKYNEAASKYYNVAEANRIVQNEETAGILESLSKLPEASATSFTAIKLFTQVSRLVLWCDEALVLIEKRAASVESRVKTNKDELEHIKVKFDAFVQEANAKIATAEKVVKEITEKAKKNSATFYSYFSRRGELGSNSYLEIHLGWYVHRLDGRPHVSGTRISGELCNAQSFTRGATVQVSAAWKTVEDANREEGASGFPGVCSSMPMERIRPGSCRKWSCVLPIENAASVLVEVENESVYLP